MGGQEKVAILMAPRLGDSLLMMVIANNFRNNGAQVSIFGDYIWQLRDWFPGFAIHRSLTEQQAHAALSSFDRAIQMHPGWPFDLTQQHPNAVIYDEHVVITGKGFVKAYQMRDFCRDYFGFAGCTHSNGMVAPGGVQKNRYPRRVAIHPTSTGALRCWAPKHFGRLATDLIKAGFEPAFIVSPDERADWQWVTGVGAALPDNQGLDGVARYIRESGWFIGNESGIGHLASAAGIPVLTLTGRMKRTRAWRPAWSISRIVAPWYIPGGRLRDRYWRILLTPQHVMWAFGKLRSDTAAATDTDTNMKAKEAA